MVTYSGKIKILDFSPEFIGHRLKANEKYKVFITKAQPKFKIHNRSISQLKIQFT